MSTTMHPPLLSLPPAERMYVYNHRLSDYFGQPVVSVAILADTGAGWRPDRYVQERWGWRLEMTYPLVKVLDVAEREATLQSSRNPFAVVVEAHLATQRTQGHAGLEAPRRAKPALLRGLYERGLERPQILELFRLIDWLLALPPPENRALWQEMIVYGEEREMPFVMDIEKDATERGLAQGQAEGRVEERRRLIQRLLVATGGVLPEAVVERIIAADAETLDRWIDRALAGARAEDRVE